MTTPQASRLALFILAAAAGLWTGCDRPKPDSPESPELKAVETPPHILHYDKDGDGVLSEDERKTMNEAFVARFDADGDGKLGAKDRSAIREKAKVSVSVAPGGVRSTKDAGVAFIRRLDKNGDGVLEAGEVDERQWKAISRMDSNGDGRVKPEEWMAGSGF